MSDPLKAVIHSERLSQRELHDIDTYWRAANYLTIGQIYLIDNPLLREPLRLEHVKPRRWRRLNRVWDAVVSST